MNKQLSVAFSIVLLLTVIVVASVDFLQIADAAKAKGNSLPETGSKKVCGDKLCSEADQSESTKTKHGESSHESKAKPGENKEKHGESSHEDKGDCRCITSIKSSVPKAELFENGVSGLEDNLKIAVSASNQEMTMSLSADELNGQYYALFVPTTSELYDVKLSGMISGVNVNHAFQPDGVLEKSDLLQFP